MGDDPGPREGQIILYSTPEGAAKIEVHLEDETFWLDQKRIAELFGVEIHTISYHLKEIFASGELVRDATLRRIRTSASVPGITFSPFCWGSAGERGGDRYPVRTKAEPAPALPR